MNRITLDEYVSKIKYLFQTIYSGYLQKKPKIYLKKNLVVGSYYSIVFKHAKKFPLLQLLKNCWVTELHSIDIRVKSGLDQYINDIDLEWFVLDFMDEEDALYILITRGQISEETIERLFKIFAEHQILVIMLGDKDVSRLWRWVQSGNINACIVFLFMLVTRVTSCGDRDYRWGPDIYEQRESFIESILDKMGELKSQQLRTIIKKLEFLITYLDEGCNVTKICKRVKIINKTFYNWNDSDPAFKGMVHGYWDISHHENASYKNSPWYREKREKRLEREIYGDIKSKEITLESP